MEKMVEKTKPALPALKFSLLSLLSRNSDFLSACFSHLLISTCENYR